MNPFSKRLLYKLWTLSQKIDHRLIYTIDTNDWAKYKVIMNHVFKSGALLFSFTDLILVSHVLRKMSGKIFL